MFRLRIALALSAGLALTACSGEPSEAAMLEAVSANVKTQLDTVNAVFGAFSGKEGGLSLNIENVQKLACQKAEPQPGYNCDMIVHMKMGEHQQQQQQSARFVKSDQGWLIVE